MRILHMSDTHGRMPEPPVDGYDVIVHSGDLLPNRTFGLRVIEEAFQRAWLEENAPRWSPRYWTKPLLIVQGNHDYRSAESILREIGIDAHDISNRLHQVDGVSFYGFPWTPTFYDWNWMCGPLEMRHHLATAGELMEQGVVDVLVSHGPMYGVLDRNREGDRCGCRVLRETMQAARHPPKALLHGHIHEAAGLQAWVRGVLVSNAATTQRIVTV